ncbi:MAG TPA: type II toxin-antitoxin system RatA family toxin [Xanthobacteraceae bacterium]|nr:type II toxin-antitoxin system RatA family toxin [Xanthobacteraceae bacterium]
MPRFSTTRRVRHSASDMFDLVADIDHYPEFVPLCRGVKVGQRVAAGEGVETLRSEMTVAYKMISETFVTRVTLDKPRLQIHVQYLEGPFRELQNRWSFRPLGEQACEVEFFIFYEFRSRVLALLMGSMFDAAFRKFAEAFERRADVVFA